jgi:CRP-like cAMP-binding protein
MVATSLSTRGGESDALGARTTESPVEHALSLLLADDTEAALRWVAAALERNPWAPSTILLTSRLLARMGRSHAAADGLLLAVRRAIHVGNLPLAVAAITELRGLGLEISDALDEVAAAFCEGSARLRPGEARASDRDPLDFQPLSPLLSGPALASKASQILLQAKHADDESDAGAAGIAPVPFFSALSKDALRELLLTLETAVVPSGQRLIQEGKEPAAAFLVASGVLELSRRPAEGTHRPRTVLARVGAGALVGEGALQAPLPSATTVAAASPSILLVARRHAIEPVIAAHPDVGIKLAAHCRRHAVANLGWSSALATALPAQECAALVERLETCTFDRGEKLVAYGEDAQGMHLIVSGEVAVVAREGGGRVMLGTRSPGDTVGEVELVLCQKASVDAIAVRDTATLLLRPDEFFALVRETPAALHGLYAIAVRRHNETRLALEVGSAAVGDEWVTEEAEAAAFAPPPPVAPVAALGGRAAHGESTNGSDAVTSRPPPLPLEAFGIPSAFPRPGATPPPASSFVTAAPVAAQPPPASPFAAAAPAVAGNPLPPPRTPPPPGASFAPTTTTVPLRTAAPRPMPVVPAPRSRPALPWPRMRDVTLVIAAAAAVMLVVDLVGRRGNSSDVGMGAARSGAAASPPAAVDIATAPAVTAARPSAAPVPEAQREPTSPGTATVVAAAKPATPRSVAKPAAPVAAGSTKSPENAANSAPSEEGATAHTSAASQPPGEKVEKKASSVAAEGTQAKASQPAAGTDEFGGRQ